MAKPAKSKKELKVETRKLLEEEQREFEKAAEKSAALEEKKSEPKKETSVPFYIKNEGKELDELDFSEIYEPNYVPRKTTVKDFVFFGEDDREEENEYPGFGKHFLEILAEDEAKKNKENDLIVSKDYEMLIEQKRKNKEKDLPGYRPGESEESKYLLSPTVRASMQWSENMYNAYKSGEEWLMSEEGGDDLVKGFINNVRSAIGSGVEDFAYLLNDIAPWYTPAKKVVEVNMAGEIEEQAQRNFGNARANGVNGNVVDFLDSASKGLGYNVFGLKAGNYIQDGADTFNEYRNLRDSGYTKEEATLAMAKKAGLSFVEDKLLDKGGEWVGNRINSNLEYVTNNKPLSAKGWSDKRNRLDKIERRDIIETQAGFACFPDEMQNEYAKKIKPKKYIDNGIEKTYFDVSMHGTPKAVGFWSEETNMSPRFLAEVITHNPKYEKGQKVRLLSCNTGEKIGNEYCFAEELANIMGVEVEAPNKKLYMYPNGNTKIGRQNEGEMIIYKPNDRRRLK